MTPVRKAPKVNYCSLFGKNAAIPEYIRHAFDDMAKYGNYPAPCPVKPGSYQMKDMSVIAKTLPAFEVVIRNTTQFCTQITVHDENGKKPVQVFSYKFFLMYRKD
jgi:hypothetical protein